MSGKKRLRILHVWDCGGVAAILAKYQRKQNQVADVITRSEYDGLGINKFYASYQVAFKALRFYITVARLSRNYDLVHIHSVALSGLFMPFKRKVVEFHGEDIRLSPLLSGFRLKKYINRFVAWLLHCPVLVSTPDLLGEVKAAWLPNPVDLEHFQTVTKALYVQNWYESGAKAEALAKQEGWELSILDRSKNQSIPYSDMPAFLKQFEVFIDRYRIHSLSKTALEALAMGLTVVQWDGQLVKGLPSQHDPVRVAEQSIVLYREVLK